MVSTRPGADYVAPGKKHLLKKLKKNYIRKFKRNFPQIFQSDQQITSSPINAFLFLLVVNFQHLSGNFRDICGNRGSPSSSIEENRGDLYRAPLLYRVDRVDRESTVLSKTTKPEPKCPAVEAW
jgi:hypothetical protein